MCVYQPVSAAMGKSEPAELVLNLDGDGCNLTNDAEDGCLVRSIVVMMGVASGDDFSGLNIFIGALVGDGI